MTRGRRINLVLRASVCLLRECTLLLLVLSTLSLCDYWPSSSYGSNRCHFPWSPSAVHDSDRCPPVPYRRGSPAS